MNHHPERGIYWEYRPAVGATIHGIQHAYVTFHDGLGNAHVIRSGPKNVPGFAVGGPHRVEVGIPLSENPEEDPAGSPEHPANTRQYPADRRTNP